MNFHPVELTIIISSTCTFFLVFWYLLPTFVFRDFIVNNSVVALFSLVMSFSILLFELIIFEVIDFLEPDLRYWSWLLSLYILTSILMIFVPGYLFFYVSTATKALEQCRKSFAFICHGMFFVSFFLIGGTHVHERGWFALENYVARIGIVGTCMLAVLSGWGAVNCPYTWLTYFLQKVDAEEIAVFERKVTQALESEFLYKRKLQEARRRKMEEGYSVLTTISTWWSRDEVAELEWHLQGATNLRQDLFSHLHSLYESRFHMQRSQTLCGKIKNTLGPIPAAICIVKITVACINILLDKKRRVDPITKIFQLLDRFIGLKVSADLINAIGALWSLVFVGVLCGTQIRGFMVQVVMRIFRRISSLFTSNVMMLILTELTAMYFISSILMLRMNLPKDYRQMIDSVLGDLEFDFYHRWFDVIFVVSSIATIVIFVVAEGYTKLSKEKLG